jgi:hypothetical protein
MTPARKPMQVTFELPDEVVTQLQPFEDKLSSHAKLITQIKN